VTCPRTSRATNHLCGRVRGSVSGLVLGDTWGHPESYVNLWRQLAPGWEPFPGTQKGVCRGISCLYHFPKREGRPSEVNSWPESAHCSRDSPSFHQKVNLCWHFFSRHES
jgi:hypothetical protein